MKKIFNNANRFVIDWTLNSLCTYHCSYCPPMLHRGNNEIYDKDTDKEIQDLKKALWYLERKIQNLEKK